MAPTAHGTRARVPPADKRKAKPNGNNRQSHNAKQAIKGKSAKTRVIPNLNLDSDQEGRKAWRANRPPDGSYDLPSGFNPDQNVGSYESFKFIEATTKAHINLKKRKNEAHSNVYVAEIWGTSEQVKHAKNSIFDYISSSDARGHKVWAKVTNNHGRNDDGKLHKRLQREQKRQKFCKKVSESEIVAGKYAFSIALPWNEKNWRPEQALGDQLEALDEIRMDSLCYIHLSRQSKGTAFVLLGNDHDRLAEAATRLQQIPARVASYGLSKMQFFLLKSLPQPFDYSAFKVEQVEYTRPVYLIDAQRESAGERIAGKYLKLVPSGVAEGQWLHDDHATISSLHNIDDSGAVWMGSRHAETLNAQYLHLWVTEALKHLSVYKGLIEMHFEIGTCVFERYKRAVQLDADVMEDLLLEANDGEELDSFMAANLGDHQGEVLLERFISCRPLLAFYDHHLYPDMTLQQGLAACKPRLRAAFVIEQGPADNLRLEMEFKSNSMDEFDEVSRRWLKLKGVGDSSFDFLNVNLLDLENPHTSYGLKISRCDLLNEFRANKLRPVYHQFANKVKVVQLDSNTIAKDKRLFDIPATGTGSEVKLLYYEQGRSWSFCFANTGYFVELYTTATVDVRPADPTKPGDTRKAWPRKESWGVRVWHESWASLFSDNQELGIGRRATWQPTEAQFFPTQGYLDCAEMEGIEAEVGGGFETLLQVMKKVEEIATGAWEHKHARTKTVDRKESAIDSSSAIHNGPEPLNIVVQASSTAVAAKAIPVLGGEPPSPEAGDDLDQLVRTAPNTKKKRFQTPTAKRNATVASLKVPNSAADVRARENKSFASIEAKLYGQSEPKQKASKKPTVHKRKGKKVGEEEGTLASPSTPQVDRDTDGSWNEDSGHMPKLPTSSAGRATPVSQGAGVIQPAIRSWASVAKK